MITDFSFYFFLLKNLQILGKNNKVFQIESEPIFKVEGMLPLMQYRFMVTAVGPSGRLGGPIMSNWALSPAVDNDTPHLSGKTNDFKLIKILIKKKRIFDANLLQHIL